MRMLERIVAVLVAALLCLASLAPPSTAASGKPPGVHALLHARVLVAPGRVVENATVVIREGRIEAVGPGLAPPPDARVHDMKGLTVHAGFIDPYVTLGRLKGDKMRARGPRGVPPSPDDDDETKPEKPVKSTSPVVANQRVRPDHRVVDELRPTADALEALRDQGIVLVQAVPEHGIFRGTAALCLTASTALQTTLLATDTASVLAFEPDPDDDEDRSYPASMMGNVAVIRQTFLDAAWYEEAWRADHARPLGSLRPQTDTALAALDPVRRGTLPVIFETATLLESLRAVRLLDEVGVRRRTLVLSGEEWRRLDWMGSLRASLVVPLAFTPAPKAKTDGEWLDIDLLTLRRWRNDPANPRWMQARGLGFAFTSHRLPSLSDHRAALARAVQAGLSRDAALAALTTTPAAMLGVSDRFGTLEAGKSASLVVVDGDPFDADTHVREVWIDGICTPSAEAPHATEHAAKKPNGASKSVAKKTKSAPPFSAAELAAPPPPPPSPAAPGAVLVRNATVWTEGPQGVLEHADLLVENGKVAQVGRGLAAPGGAMIIDGSGCHVTPGLIDAHSHTAIDGAVNEGAANVSAQVRIKDVIDPFSLDIYRQLAGGVTAANVLHGSANAIGGQVVTCKWRWGEPAEALLVKDAPEGIKFALGENPKQSNWGSHKRYPHTRMGVAELLRDRFVAARDYRRAQEAHRAGRRPIAPRPDLALDALLEVLDGKRYVHCHSYRQDEILMLIHLADEMGFKVRAFQHVLEGYKVADEIARHGAGASTFSDWWGYKYEVIDGIPYNGALMHDRGVVVSFNSDSDEQARRLNTEAAKAVRYGRLDETDALAFVTINPARQLGLDHRMGSLQTGRDGDFVLWSDHPLSQRAVCLQTWIEGRRYFDRTADAMESKRTKTERETLIARAKSAGHADEGKGKEKE